MAINNGFITGSGAFDGDDALAFVTGRGCLLGLAAVTYSAQECLLEGVLTSDGSNADFNAGLGDSMVTAKGPILDDHKLGMINGLGYMKGLSAGGWQLHTRLLTGSVTEPPSVAPSKVKRWNGSAWVEVPGITIY